MEDLKEEEKSSTATKVASVVVAVAAAVAESTTKTTTKNVKKKRKLHHHHHYDDELFNRCNNISNSSRRHRQKTAIQNTENELIKAKQRVIELESILQRLRRREELDYDESNMAEKKKEEKGEDEIDKKMNNNNEDDDGEEEEERRRLSCCNEDNDNEDSSSLLLLLHGQTLQLILEFLHPKDVLTSCVQVCHRWQHDIDNNQQIWRNVAQNLSSPEFIIALEEKRDDDWNWNDHNSDDDASQHDDSNENNDIDEKNESNNNQLPSSTSPPASKSSAKNKDTTTTTTSPPKDYKKVVLGLIRSKSRRDDDDNNNAANTTTNNMEVCVDQKYYVPKLQPKDVFVYIEIIDSISGNVIEFRYKNLVDMIFFATSPKNGKPIFKPWLDANRIPGNILLPTKVDVGTLQEHFFHDYDGDFDDDYDDDDDMDDLVDENYVPSYIYNNISFRLRLIRGDTGHSFYCGNLGGENNNIDRPYGMTIKSDRIRPEAKNEFGIVARDMWWARKYIGMYTEVEYLIVPDHGDQEGYSFHNWRETKYRIVGMQFFVKVDRCPFSSSDSSDDDDFDDELFPNMQDLMLSIEGLAWQ